MIEVGRWRGKGFEETVGGEAFVQPDREGN
jgi:hypothetical protein